MATITLRFKADTEAKEEDSVVKYMRVSMGQMQRDTRRVEEWRNKPDTTFQTPHDNDNILQSKPLDCSQSKPVTTAVFTTPTTTHGAASTCAPSGNTRTKTRLNSNARPFTPLPQCDGPVDNTPQQGCDTNASNTKACEYDYSG